MACCGPPTPSRRWTGTAPDDAPRTVDQQPVRPGELVYTGHPVAGAERVARAEGHRTPQAQRRIAVGRVPDEPGGDDRCPRQVRRLETIVEVHRGVMCAGGVLEALLDEAPGRKIVAVVGAGALTTGFLVTHHNQDIFIVFATVDPDAGHRGITAFLVDRGTATRMAPTSGR